MNSQAQGPERDYALHTLGWKGFQDLCGTIISEVLGQAAQTFSPTNDGGRDGGFQGSWNTPDQNLTGTFAIQCKFLGNASKLLRVADLQDEVAKVRRLAARGLAQNYILLTNAPVSGALDEKIRQAFIQIPGINTFQAFGREWITSKIRESPRLRMMVPRIYGLGDLTQILDERKYLQARAILSTMGDDLAKLVVTQPHQQSARALIEKGFVLLLGEPASGKSTIGASLAVGALDLWHLPAMRVKNAEEFAKAWNPKERQFFWIDDAFGPTQMQTESVVEWNRVFPEMRAAIKNGCKVLLTSRTYIYNDARFYLKANDFPLITSSQVIIYVQNLTQREREQILYNHIKLGNQKRRFRTQLKPFLEDIASSSGFLPEIARRLGSSEFTKSLQLTKEGIKDFVDRPVEFLRDILLSLHADKKAAIALLFMQGGSIESPIEYNADTSEALQLLGVTQADVRTALNALEGSLVKLVISEGVTKWTFRHPTIADAFALVVAADPELRKIYLSGTPPEKLVREVVCGAIQITGASVIVPASLFWLVERKLGDVPVAAKFLFLANRCSRDFLSYYLSKDSTLIDTVATVAELTSGACLALAARLQQYGLLPAVSKDQIRRRVIDIAVEGPSADFLEDRSVDALFDADELEAISTAVKDELLPGILDVVDNLRWNYSGDDPDDYYAALVDTLQSFEEAWADDEMAKGALARAMEKTLRHRDDAKEEYEQSQNQEYEAFEYPGVRASESQPESRRSIFDDIDV